VQPDVLRDFGGSLSPAVRAAIPEAIAVGLSILAAWGIPATQRTQPAHDTLLDPSLALTPYETGRPGEDEACRVGDPRVLAMRLSHD
jgi:hydrogenase maturation protease